MFAALFDGEGATGRLEMPKSITTPVSDVVLSISLAGQTTSNGINSFDFDFLLNKMSTKLMVVE
jgi:hypothetical protein